MEAEFEHLTRRAKTKVKVRDDVAKGPSRRASATCELVGTGAGARRLDAEAELKRLEKVREKRRLALKPAWRSLIEPSPRECRKSAIQTDARREPRRPCATTEEDAGRRAALLLPATRRARRQGEDLG